MGVLVFFGLTGKILTIYVIKCRWVLKLASSMLAMDVGAITVASKSDRGIRNKKKLRTQRKTWTTNLITLNSIFAISYLLTMAPIDIWVLVSIDWKQAAFVCKFGMFWVYVCSGKISDWPIDSPIRILDSFLLTKSRKVYRLYQMLSWP